MKYFTKKYWKEAAKLIPDGIKYVPLDDKRCTIGFASKLFESKRSNYSLLKDKSIIKNQADYKKYLFYEMDYFYVHMKEWLPKWLLDECEYSLLAFGYVPKSKFGRFEKEAKTREKFIIHTRKKYAEELKHIAPLLPKGLAEKFDSFCTMAILSIRKAGKDYEMILEWSKWSFPLDEEVTPYLKLVFKNGKILEREPGITCHNYDPLTYIFEEHNRYPTIVSSEIHLDSRGRIEVHIIALGAGSSGFQYLTIRCDNIRIIDNYSDSKYNIRTDGGHRIITNQHCGILINKKDK